MCIRGMSILYDIMPSSSAEKMAIVRYCECRYDAIYYKQKKKHEKTSHLSEYPEEMGTKIPKSATRYPLHRGQAKGHCQ